MTITLLYFAAVRELLGREQEELTLPEGTHDLEQLARVLCERYPALTPRLPSIRFAQNERFVEAHARLADGDVIALIPPVAGG